MINVVQLGTVPYGLGLRLQEELVAARKSGRISDTLLLLEHAPVITLGRNAKHKHVLATDEQLASRGVELFECNRGGDVTLHGTGQIVGYPIFNLVEKQPKIGVVEFLRRLEEVLIRTCADFGIGTHRIAGLTGVWTGTPSQSDHRPHVEAKIAAMGVHISRGVTSHGFALNVNNDLDYFRLIVPCGISARPVTSIASELTRPVSLDDVAHSLARHTGQVFGSQILWVDTIDALLGRTVGVPMKRPIDVDVARDTEAALPA
jgi:lipoyl(octanoyl) transferase